MRAFGLATPRKQVPLWRLLLPLMGALVIAGYAAFGELWSAGATTTVTDVPGGNTTCSAQGYDHELKVDGPTDTDQKTSGSSGTYAGTYSDNTLTVTIRNVEENSDGEEVIFDWASSTIPVDAVLVKAQGTLKYAYNPPVLSDDDLTAPDSKGISHISFCYNDVVIQPLQVEKTVDATFDRTWNWEITKEVDLDTHNLLASETGQSDYTVTVTKSGPVDSNWQVSGTITITNPNDEAVEVSSISDSVDGVSATITSAECATPFEVPANDSVDCDYSANEGDGLDGTEDENVATVTASDSDLSGNVTEPFTYMLDQETNASVTVSDTNDEFGPNQSVSTSDTFEYSIIFDCEGVEYDENGEASYTHPNTAEIEETGQMADANVTVNCSQFDPLGVTKTVVASFDQDYDWAIEKSVDPDAWTLVTGDSGTSEYTVSATRTGPFNSGFSVSGQITIVNQNPDAVDVVSVVDTITPGNIAADVVCGVTFPYTLAPFGQAGDTLVCTYAADETDGLDGNETLNSVVVTTEPGAANGSDTATISYVVDEVTDESLTVDDTNGDTFTFNGSGTETYTETFTCDDDAGEHVNTITADASEQGELSDSATVTVNCTDEPPGTITIEKDATPGDSPWIFHFDGPGDLTASLLSGQTSSETLAAGSYTISEDLDELIGDTSGVAAWDLTDIVCVSDTGESTFDYDVDAGSVTVNLAAGDDVDCTFFNEQNPPVVIPEAPFAILFPIIGLLVAAGGYLFWRRRERLGRAG